MPAFVPVSGGVIKRALGGRPHALPTTDVVGSRKITDIKPFGLVGQCRVTGFRKRLIVKCEEYPTCGMATLAAHHNPGCSWAGRVEAGMRVEALR